MRASNSRLEQQADGEKALAVWLKHEQPAGLAQVLSKDRHSEDRGESEVEVEER